MLNFLVADVSVVPIPNDHAGELPRAYIVKSALAKNLDDNEIKDQLHAEVNTQFAQYTRLAGGIIFVDALPKTASGKVQRALVKQMAKDAYVASKKALALQVLQSSIQIFEFDSEDEEEHSEP
jgi:acyl-coenzyme A synthetase/AMP-(fatty) acid ligase